MIQRYESLHGGMVASINGAYMLSCDVVEALAEKDREIERFRNRDGKAYIELCYDDGNNPFARSECMVVDFGVCDNQYIIESELLNKTLSEAKGWRDMCDKLAEAMNDVIDNSIPDDNDAAFCFREKSRELLSAYNAMKEAGK